jgi:hypothetical protein
MGRFLIQAPAGRNIPNRMYTVYLPVEMQDCVDQGILSAITEFVDGLVVPAD